MPVDVRGRSPTSSASSATGRRCGGPSTTSPTTRPGTPHERVCDRDRSQWPGRRASHVDDDGPGIPESDRADVVQRFVRLDEGRARDVGGAGLGLAVASDVAAAHGGRLEIGDSPLGGARVTITLPGNPRPDETCRLRSRRRARRRRCRGGRSLQAIRRGLAVIALAGAAAVLVPIPVAAQTTPLPWTIYVADAQANVVRPIDAATLTVGAPIAVGAGPGSMAITPDARTLYVANSGAGSVTPVDIATGAPAAAIVVPPGTDAGGLSIAPAARPCTSPTSG